MDELEQATLEAEQILADLQDQIGEATILVEEATKQLSEVIELINKRQKAKK